jgi:hypothetical protein
MKNEKSENLMDLEKDTINLKSNISCQQILT